MKLRQTFGGPVPRNLAAQKHEISRDFEQVRDLIDLIANISRTLDCAVENDGSIVTGCVF